MKYPKHITQKTRGRKTGQLSKVFYELSALFYRLSTGKSAHKDLVELENLIDGKLTIITTNIDDLHTRAGSKEVLHIHGIITQDRQIDENKSFPNCVLFGENK